VWAFFIRILISQDYLSSPDCGKIMEEKTKYISLAETSKYCNYSQEYLSLRARQGKLKAIKIGRNWVTKKEWLRDYLNKIKNYE